MSHYRNRRTAPQSRKKRGGWGYILLIILFAAVFLYAAYRLGDIVYQYAAGQQEYKDLAQYGPKWTPAPVLTSFPAEGDEGETPQQEVPQAEPQPSLAPETPAVDFEALRQTNPDVVAWIVVEGTQINYPVVQGENNEYYLNHTFSNKRNSSGSIFLDFRSAADFSDRHSTLYGHHMRDGSMFAGLMEFKDKAFFEAHPYILLYTPEGTHRLRIFSSYVSSGFRYNVMQFENDAIYLDYLNRLHLRSQHYTEIELDAQSRILTLSTCTYEVEDARYVVHAVFEDAP